MRWSYWIYICAFLAAFAVFLVARVPASVGADLVSDRLPALSLGGLHGTVWHGGARRVGYREGLAEGVRWRFRPGRLLALELSYRLQGELGDGSFESTATLRPGGRLALAGVRLESDIAVLAAFAGKSYIPLQGRVRLQFDRLVMADRIKAASGTVTVSDARLSERATDLGSYRAKITDDDGTLRASVDDSGGPLDVSGSASLDPRGRYEVSVDIVPKRSNPELESLLGLVSRRGRDGTYRIRGQGTL